MKELLRKEQTQIIKPLKEYIIENTEELGLIDMAF